MQQRFSARMELVTLQLNGMHSYHSAIKGLQGHRYYVLHRSSIKLNLGYSAAPALFSAQQKVISVWCK